MSVLKKQGKANKGITLIALVVTIVVLLILAGISIATLTGENGIVKEAKTAKELAEKADLEELVELSIIQAEQKHRNPTIYHIIEELKKNKVISKDEQVNKETGSIITDVGYEITGKLDDYIGKDSEPIFTTVANAPDIGGFNKSNTYYVTWNENGEKTAYVPDERKMSENVEPDNWYDYTSGINHWANVKTTGGGNNCYWVWIPRYAYKVPTKPTTDKPTAETIEVKFLQGRSNIPIGETEAITNTNPIPGTWVVHPAFTTIGNGGFGELSGIWVAKYEASSSQVSEKTLATDLTTEGGGNVTNLQVRVKPNVTSWRGISVNNIFTVCKNLTKTGNSLENTSKLDAHMMKNTEWGAVAYLSMSQYGKNGEVWNNPYYNDETNFSPITGLCGNASNGKDNATTDITKTCKYNEAGGGNASTTGNVYGVYDMAGGAWEYTAGYLSEITPLTNYTMLASADNKYKDVYAGTSSDRDENYNANKGKYGDAVYETSISGVSESGSWDSSYARFPNATNQVFLRGGRANNTTMAGMFAFGNWSGVADTTYSFRPVLAF